MKKICLAGTAALAVTLTSSLALAPASAELRVGTVKKVDVGPYRPGGTGRPELGTVIVKWDGERWRATLDRAAFKLDVYAEAGPYSKIARIEVRLDAAPRYQAVLFADSSRRNKKIRVNGGVLRVPGSDMGRYTGDVQNLCSVFGPKQRGTSTLVRQLAVTVMVTSQRHNIKTYYFRRNIDYAIRCVHPGNTSSAQRQPSRVPPAFRVTRASILFSKERKATCPKKVSIQATVHGTAEGRVAYRVVRSDGRIVMKGHLNIRKVGTRFRGDIVKLDTIRSNHNFKYRLETATRDHVKSRWIPLRVRCRAPGKPGSFAN
mgnify:CR=1 FL=1